MKPKCVAVFIAGADCGDILFVLSSVTRTISRLLNGRHHLFRPPHMSLPFTIIALVVSLLAFVFSLLGVAMAFWVAAVPGNTPEHVRLNFLVWVAALMVTLGFTLFFAFRLVIRFKR